MLNDGILEVLQLIVHRQGLANQLTSQELIPSSRNNLDLRSRIGRRSLAEHGSLNLLDGHQKLINIHTILKEDLLARDYVCSSMEVVSLSN